MGECTLAPLSEGRKEAGKRGSRPGRVTRLPRHFRLPGQLLGGETWSIKERTRGGDVKGGGTFTKACLYLIVMVDSLMNMLTFGIGLFKALRNLIPRSGSGVM